MPLVQTAADQQRKSGPEREEKKIHLSNTEVFSEVNQRHVCRTLNLAGIDTESSVTDETQILVAIHDSELFRANLDCLFSRASSAGVRQTGHAW